jgi:hypothetical protein
MKMRKWSLAVSTLASLTAIGCTDDKGTDDGGVAGAAGMMEETGGTMAYAGAAGRPEMASGGKGGAGGAPGSAGMPSQAMAGGSAMSEGGAAGHAGMTGAAGQEMQGGAGMAGSKTKFVVRIENTSDTTALPTPFAPGAYAVHASGKPLFQSGVSVAGQGLEKLAEDGNPKVLAAALETDPDASASGVFDTPEGADEPGPALPGKAFEFVVSAKPGDRLSLASMVGQTNDWFLGTAPQGLPLFDDDGAPIDGDVTAKLGIWDAGTERNEAPWLGPTQAPRQPAPNTGPAESGVSARVDGTRAIPLPASIVEVAVQEEEGTFTITLKNVSDEGPLLTPISPVFFAAHDADYQVFAEGSPASSGLEKLAEDGDPSELVASADAAGALADSAGTAPITPGNEIELVVEPTRSARYLSLATMVGQSNDAFLGTRPEGVALLDAEGEPRDAADVAADLRRSLATWDAGTEANEVVGVGPNQGPRQSGPNVGPPDPDDSVRLYDDSTNDLAPGEFGELMSVTIEHTSGLTFEVTVSNTSGGSADPLLLSPVAWAVHDDTVSLFTLGEPASEGIEHLAEDGNPQTLSEDLAAEDGVADSGAQGSAPVMAGDSLAFEVTVDAMHPYLSVASMVAPSNDTFWALGAMGIRLLDSEGMPRSDEDIAGDVADALGAFDAGTEANQASALGPDMPPQQSAPNTGADEGSGLVRPVDSVWSYPPVSDLVRVSVSPM